MYYPVLFLHSWVRWLVLGLGVGLLLYGGIRAARGRAADRTEHVLRRIFAGVFELQVALGLALYFFFSPVVAAVWSYPGNWTKIRGLRFWAMEHIGTMLIALAVLHLGGHLGRRSLNPRTARRWNLGSVALSLVLILAAIPWPQFAHGRPLFRLLQ